MSKNNFKYGALTNVDIKQVELSLDLLKSTFPNNHINILEIGIYKGQTSRGVKKKLEAIGLTNYTYWAIDTGKDRDVQIPFENCKLIIGNSDESFDQLPQLHWVFIDGCHCVNHVMLDFLNYGYKVINSGFLLFHDTSPNSQGKGYQGHGPKTRHFGVSVLDAFKKLDIFNRTDWKYISDDYDESKSWGGISIFQKTKVIEYKARDEQDSWIVETGKKIRSSKKKLENVVKFWDGKFKKTIKKEYSISFCTTCMGRLYNLKETLPVNIEANKDYPNLEFVILDYNSNDGLWDWMKTNMMCEIETGRVSYYRTTEPQHYSMAHSRNIAYKIAKGEIVNNLDADNFTVNNKGIPIKECWASYLNRLANEQDEKIIFAKGKRGMRGRIGFYKNEFIELLGGYDEDLLGYGHDDHDLVYRAWGLEFTMYWWGGKYYHRIKTTRKEKNTYLERPWKVTENENKAKSAENLAKGKFKANEGRHWGKTTLIKNFTEEIET